MRKTFIDTLAFLARKDKDIFLLTGDLGFSVFEEFAAEFPDRFINCGVMEQSMISIAAGLALSGKKPYVYSIIPFVTMRPFEQIRNDVCYQNLNVKIIGIGAGFAYGALGSTHYAIEDVSLLRSLPNLTVVSPADAKETKALLLQTYQKKGPSYIRLLKPETSLVPKKVATVLSKPSVVQKGKDGVLITVGAALATGLQVAEQLKKKGYSLQVVSMHTLKPVDRRAFLTAVKNQTKVFTLEEHRLAGGLGSVVAELFFAAGRTVSLQAFGVGEGYSGVSGHQHFLEKEYGLDAKTVSKKILASLRKK